MLHAIELNSLIVREQGIFFVPYSKSHVAEMDIQTPELRAEAVGADIGDILLGQSNMGVCATVIWQSRPVAIFGSVAMWPGVHEAWAVIDDYARARPKQMLKIGRQFMDIVKVRYNLHRQQLYVRSDDERAVRYAQALGFETEGLMRSYTTDKMDSYMMARL